MPINYEIEPDLRILCIRVTNPLTGRELSDYFHASRADELIGPTLNRLLDLRDVTDFPTVEEIVEAARERGFPLAAGAKMAVVANNNFAYGMARVFAGVTADETIAVFRSEQLATEWLRSGHP